MIKLINNSSDDFLFDGISIPNSSTNSYTDNQISLLFKSDDFVNNLRNNNISFCVLGEIVKYPECISIILETYFNDKKKDVTTLFEKDDKDLKLSSLSVDVDSVTGLAKTSILIPGIPGSGQGRYLAGGEAFFDQAHDGDKITKIQVVDYDDLLGYGAGTIIKTYHDEDVIEENQGWFISVMNRSASGNAGHIEIETFAGYGFIPAGFYLEIEGKKAIGHYSGRLFLNIEAGKQS